MRNILFCILFVFIQLYCKSQVAGYMGKRFTVGLSSSLAPNFKILYLLDNPQSPYLGPVITNSLNIEYVMSNRRMICFSFRQLTRKIDHEYYVIDRNTTKSGFEKFHLFNYSIGVKRFSKRGIAPLGFYTKWECYYINGWMNYKPYLYPSENYYTDELVQYDGGKIKFFGSGGAYSIGKQRVFKDKYVVDFGVRATLMVVLFKSANEYEKRLALYASDVSIFSLTNFHIGIGFLAF